MSGSRIDASRQHYRHVVFDPPPNQTKCHPASAQGAAGEPPKQRKYQKRKALELHRAPSRRRRCRMRYRRQGGGSRIALGDEGCFVVQRWL